jgi:phosphoribosylanthranilate isomerase
MTSRQPIGLKVCGMRDPENIREVAALRPDYMGFIFYEKSPRYVGPDFVLPTLPVTVKLVGVFVDHDLDHIVNMVRQHALDFVQLHGHEPVSMVEELRSLGIRTFKVFSVDKSFDFSVIEPFEKYADYFLFDTKGQHYGGNARRFDWSLLHKYNQRVPFLLSGGLNSENVGEIDQLKGMNLHALDINSGVEISPAVKDPVKVKAVKELILK